MSREGQSDGRPVSAENFRYIRDLVLAESAIVVGEDKEYLVESRLAPLAAQQGLPSLNALVDRLRLGVADAALRRGVVEAMTTNETLFFRDHHPFEALRQEILPALLASRPSGQIVLWSAACSTGQEPYSLAMLVREHFPEAASRMRILATDFSGPVLARARAGLYHQLEVNRGLPASYLVKYFAQGTAGWQLREDVRSMVEFRELNLSRPWSGLPSCDLVLMRNVMIYFSTETRRRILAQVRGLLAPGGLLLLGGAETAYMIDDGYAARTVGRTTFYHTRVHEQLN